MGSVVSKRGSIGQWGSNLYVSKPVAEDVCQEVWGVPAQFANIDFAEGSGSSGRDALRVATAPENNSDMQLERQDIVVEGWSCTRAPGVTSRSPQNGRIPVLWTPTIKALWAPFVPLPASREDDDDNALPLHKLRLSASALRLHFCGQNRSKKLGIPLGVGLSVDNLLIEIARQDGTL